MIAEGTYYTANNNCIISYMKYRGRKMKKLFAVYFLIVLVILSSCNTKKVDLSKFSEANITYVYEDKNIHETLDDTDTNEIKNIFNGKMIMMIIRLVDLMIIFQCVSAMKFFQ